MKKLFFVLLSFSVLSVHAQSVDEVIQKYAANMGGLEAFNKITSAKMTGSVTAQGNELAVTTQIINGKDMRLDIDVKGQFIVNCYNNGKGWKINPFQGAPTATEVSGNELNDFKTQSNLATQLMDYKARGYTVEMPGEETVDGTKAFKINLTNTDDGKLTTYFIASADHTLIESITPRTIMGKEVQVETRYSDLKEIGGVKFFMTRNQKIEGRDYQLIKFDKIELNVPIDKKIFEMPK
jgi:hypothetical protein